VTRTLCCACLAAGLAGCAGMPENMAPPPLPGGEPGAACSVREVGRGLKADFSAELFFYKAR